MLADGIEHAAHIDQPFSVQLQGFNRRSSDRGESGDLDMVFAPGEMIAPLLLPRVEQRDGEASHWVYRLSLRRLMTVAPLATQGEIVG